MKLLTKTSLYFLLLSIPTLILSGFICYNLITSEVKDSNDELLNNRIAAVENYLKENDTVALNLLTKSGEAQINRIVRSHYANGEKTIFADTLILDKKENELAPNKMICSIVSDGKDNYQIKIWRSTLEYNELIEGIFYLLIVILFFLFLISLLINYWISKTLWNPFYQTLAALKTFSASDNQRPELIKTEVKELSELNNSLNSMMDKMILDYNSQKKFSENASHEIQTPLAVIKSKVDLLIQSKTLQKNEVELIVAIDDACSKLIRLNKSLLLLTKIENRQFNTTEKVSFEKIVDHSLVLFQEYIQAHSIEIIKTLVEDFCVEMNADLGSILINNLLQNAIKHDISGKIEILIEKTKIIISNPGKGEALHPLLFERFQKDTTSEQSLGLGLALIKEITEVSDLSLEYYFVTDKHQFIISSKK